MALSETDVMVGTENALSSEKVSNNLDPHTVLSVSKQRSLGSGPFANRGTFSFFFGFYFYFPASFSFFVQTPTSGQCGRNSLMI